MTPSSPRPRFACWHEIGLLALVTAVLTWAGLTDRAFLSRSVQVELPTHAWDLALLALPMTLIILTGGIDLSIGATMALAAVVLRLGYEAGSRHPARHPLGRAPHPRGPRVRRLALEPR
jgi:ribose/xylose/arabinose/galactoside ABC-type transport system permease subunit